MIIKKSFDSRIGANTSMMKKLNIVDIDNIQSLIKQTEKSINDNIKTILNNKKYSDKLNQELGSTSNRIRELEELLYNTDDDVIISIKYYDNSIKKCKKEIDVLVEEREYNYKLVEKCKIKIEYLHEIYDNGMFIVKSDDNNYKNILKKHSNRMIEIYKQELEYSKDHVQQDLLYGLIKNVYDSKRDIDVIDIKIKKLNVKLNKHEKKLEKMNELNDKKIRNKKVKSKIMNEIDILSEIKEKIEGLDGSTNKLINENNKLNTKLVNMKLCQKTRNTLKDERMIYMNLVDIFDNPKEENSIIDFVMTKKIIPEFESTINNITTNIGLNYNINITYINKNIGIYINKKGSGDIIEIANTSGFENDIFNLLCRYASVKINDVFTSNFFIIDEGMKYCDTDKKYIMKNLVNEMKKSYDWILLISHNSNIRELLFDKTIKITTKTLSTSFINV